MLKDRMFVVYQMDSRVLCRLGYYVSEQEPDDARTVAYIAFANGKTYRYDNVLVSDCRWLASTPKDDSAGTRFSSVLRDSWTDFSVVDAMPSAERLTSQGWPDVQGPDPRTVRQASLHDALGGCREAARFAF